MGQELLPERGATIASLLMGGAWGVGALLVAAVGALADLAGLHAALLALCGTTALGLLCAWALPSRGRAETGIPVAQGSPVA